MRSLSLLLLVAATAFAVEEITDNGYAIPEYDPLPSDGEPVETPENTDWAPTDRELEASDAVDINDVDGGRAEDAWFHHGHHGHHGLHGHHGRFHHGGFRNGHLLGHHFGHHFGHFHHRRPWHRHHRPTVVVTDRHHVVAHPKKPCTKVVKHVTVHTHARPHHHHQSSSSSFEEPTCGCRAHRHHHHHPGHHHSSSSSSEEQPTCGCRAHHGGHHHHHGIHGHGHHFGHHGHHGHQGHGLLPIAPFL
ncbi:hypothetical protein PRIPAC_98076 [Pristionchus pacificus]|uniref:Uncharacterized protein n=1 Tax=Pristionchus pacificus TaxID=54126 RepID=A0A454XI14_PRIPA|nr:hypothetical protein PRIPAC_98076 [Pristionchus pacificus]|eukprot:PDM66169.1 hypothetical protein PRIPAC_45394 [Pristionchus pacificus]